MADLQDLVRPALGLLMVFGPYVAYRRRRGSRRAAEEGLPALAARLGLEHRPPAIPGLIGSVRGRFRGWEIFVDSDERPRVVVYLPGAPGLVLRTWEHEKRVPPGMERFDSGEPGVDARLRERFASAEVAARLRAAAPAVGACLERLLAPPAKDLSVTSERVELTFEIGRPRHVPIPVLERCLPVATELAALVVGAPPPGA